MCFVGFLLNEQAMWSQLFSLSVKGWSGAESVDVLATFLLCPILVGHYRELWNTGRARAETRASNQSFSQNSSRDVEVKCFVVSRLYLCRENFALNGVI